jgi:hypothetical protein
MKFEDLELAFEFVNSSPPFEHIAYVSRSTGETYWESDAGDLHELPDDLEGNDDYVEIPDKRDLNLGTRLVMQFVNQEIPGLEDNVRSIFSRKGAYGRYKAFLDQLGLLNKWHSFEAAGTKEALMLWCKDNDIQIELE